MSVTSSASGMSAIRTRRSGSRKYDDSGTPSTPTSLRRSLLKPRSFQSAYYDEKEGVWKCRNCGWAYPHARPGAAERREHKKHCHETLKIQRWLAFADFRDGRTDLPKAEKQPVDDNRGAAMDQGQINSAATKSLDAADIEDGADSDNEKNSSLLGRINKIFESRTEPSTGDTPVGTAAKNGTKGERDADISFQGGDLQGPRPSQKGHKTLENSSPGVTRFRSSVLDPSGVDSSGVVAYSEDAEVHDMEVINNVNKFQKEKQAGSGSLQVKPGTSNQHKHEIDADEIRAGVNVDTRLDPDCGKEGAVMKMTDVPKLTSAATNWEDWEDIVRENTAHRGFRCEPRDLEMDKTGFPIVDTKRNESGMEDPHRSSSSGRTFDERSTEPITRSLVERNWDDWDDVILQSSMLFSAKGTVNDAAMLSLDRKTSENRESAGYGLESGQENDPMGPATPDREPIPPRDDSTPMREGRERIPVGCEFPSGVDNHLSEAIALWKTRDNKTFVSFRAVPLNKAHDVGLVSSRSRSRRRSRQYFKDDGGRAKSPSGRKAQTRNRSTISNAPAGCFPLRKRAKSYTARSSSQGAEREDTLVLLPTPDCVEERRRPTPSIDHGKAELVEPIVSTRRNPSPGRTAESSSQVRRSSSAPLAIIGRSSLGFRSWKFNFLQAFRNQTKYSIRCPRCELATANRMNMRQKWTQYISGRKTTLTATHEIEQEAVFSPVSAEFASFDTECDEWCSMSDSSSSETDTFHSGIVGVRGCIDYFLCP